MENEYHNINVFDIDKVFIEGKNSIINSDKNGFFLCRQGTMTLSFEDNLFDIKAGDMYIYPPFSQIHITKVSSDIKGIIGVADFDFVVSSLSSISNAQNYVHIRNRPCVTLNEEQQIRLEEIIALIRHNLGENEKLFQTAIISMLTKILCYKIIEIYISNNSISPRPQNRKDCIFQRFLTDVNKYYTEQRNIKFYADQQCLTPRYFATIIREKSGKSPSEWITMFVINKAKRLIEDPNLSIKEIAEMLNFANQSFFGRYFKQNVGMSPAKYREQ